MSFVTILRSSEFWVGLVAAVLQFLVSQGVLNQTTSDFINMAIVYILARVFGKVAKAAIKPAA